MQQLNSLLMRQIKISTSRNYRKSSVPVFVEAKYVSKSRDIPTFYSKSPHPFDNV